MACLGEDLILSFVRGGLPPGTVAEIDGHVDACSACRQLIAHVARTSLVQARSSDAPPEASRRTALAGASIRADEAVTARPNGRATNPEAANAAGATPLARGTPVGRYVVLR